MARFLSLLTTLSLKKPLISKKVPMGRPSKTQVSNDSTSDEEEEEEVAADNHQIEDDDEELEAVAQSASSDDDDNSPDEAADDDDDNKQVISNPNLCIFICGRSPILSCVLHFRVYFCAKFIHCLYIFSVCYSFGFRFLSCIFLFLFATWVLSFSLCLFLEVWFSFCVVFFLTVWWL